MTFRARGLCRTTLYRGEVLVTTLEYLESPPPAGRFETRAIVVHPKQMRDLMQANYHTEQAARDGHVDVVWEVTGGDERAIDA